MMLPRALPLALAVVLSSAALSHAQAPPEAPVIRLQQERADMLASERNVRIDVTVTIKGLKPVAKTLTMVTADGRSAKSRAGVEIPVSMGGPGIGAGGPVAEGFNYRPVDINVDATATILASGRILLRLKMNFQTVYLPTDAGTQRASFGSGTTELNAVVFESGKPLIVTQAADGDSGREYNIEVKTTILK
jgi:hypothetical protein